MDRWLNTHKLHSMGVDMNNAELRFGVITSYDPVRGAARAAIQPEGALTPWMPVGAVAVGAASIVAPPNVGDQVVLAPREGDAQSWVIVARLFSNGAPPPVSPVTSQPVQSGEVAIIAGATCLHLTGGQWQMHGNLVVMGNITATGNIIAGFGTGDQVGVQTHTHGTGPSPNPGT